MHLFLGAMAQIERHLALRIGFSVSNEAEPCDPVWKSGHFKPSKYSSAFPCFCSVCGPGTLASGATR